MDLEHDTRLTGAEGRYTLTLSRDWEVWGPNGGYMAAIALRAAGMEARIKRPASISCHFLSVARFEPVDIEVTPAQQGRRAESFHVLVRQGDRAILQAIVRTAAEGPGLEHLYGAMPDVPDPEGLLTWPDIFPNDGPIYPFWNNIEGRHPESHRIKAEVDAGLPRPARDPHHVEWFRFQPNPTFDDPFVDAGRLLVLIDTLSWPAASEPHQPEPKFQAPNLDVTAWFHRPAHDAEWLLAEHRSPVGTNGLMGTESRIWSRDGRLLASGGAQLVCLPASPARP